MVPGYVLFLTGLLLAASAPLILAAVIGSLFFPSAMWAARSAILGGLPGAALGGLWWLLANVFSVPPGHLSAFEGASLCAVGFSFGSTAGFVFRATARCALRKASLVLVAFLLGNAFALLSVLIERRGPELLSYGNMCGPTSSDECYEPALKGGFPFAYLTDLPGVSVEHQLSFGEDTLHPPALVLDIAVYVAATLCLLWYGARLTGRSRPTATPEL